MPTVGSMQAGLIDYAVGIGGSLVYELSQRFLGTGIIGGIVGAALAKSVIKGDRGTALATILGFQSGLGATLGSGLLGGGSSINERGSI